MEPLLSKKILPVFFGKDENFPAKKVIAAYSG